jgi:hypothetical protein
MRSDNLPHRMSEFSFLTDRRSLFRSGQLFTLAMVQKGLRGGNLQAILGVNLLRGNPFTLGS